MEVTKWLKPLVSVSRIGDSASVQAVTRVNAEQASNPILLAAIRRDDSNHGHCEATIGHPQTCARLTRLPVKSLQQSN
jgi:hypothetical protein